MASKKRQAAILSDLKGLKAIQRYSSFCVQNLILGRGDPERLFQPSRFMITHNQHYFHIYFTTVVSDFSTRPPRAHGKQLKQALNTTILPQYLLKRKVVLSLRTSSKCSPASSHQQGFY